MRYSELPSISMLVVEDVLFSAYNGIVVCWDVDRDTRILDLIDALPDHVVDNLLAVGAREGVISFRWKSHVPDEFAAGKFIGVPGGDVWSVFESSVLADDQN